MFRQQARAPRRHLQSGELDAAEEQLSAAEQQICEEPCPKKTKVDESSSCPLLSLGSDLLPRCASYLDPDCMVQLERTSTMFGRIQPGRQRSLVNETAHQVFLGALEHERDALPKYADESDIKLYRELLLLRQALVFIKCSPNVQISDMGMRLMRIKIGWGTAISSEVMRGGKHFVRFPITKHEWQLLALIGIVRPLAWRTFAKSMSNYDHAVLVHGHDDSWASCDLARLLRNEAIPSMRCIGSGIHCCAYSCVNGNWYSTNWGNAYVEREDWPGVENMQQSGEIAMLLDFVAGTLTIYKNGRRLGIAQEGLAGEYSWMVSLGSRASIGIGRGQMNFSFAD